MSAHPDAVNDEPWRGTLKSEEAPPPGPSVMEEVTGPVWDCPLVAFVLQLFFVRNVASSWNHGLIHIVVHWRARSLNIMGSFCPVHHQ